MLRKLNSKNISISGKRDRIDLQVLLGVDAAADVLQFLDDTDVGKKLPGESDHNDSWDIERLDRTVEEGEMAEEIGSG